MQLFHLQRLKQRLGLRVVVAIAVATHRSPDAVLLDDRAEVLAGVLTAVIAAKDQLSSLRAVLKRTQLQPVGRSFSWAVRRCR
jgi:hypothetical protein